MITEIDYWDKWGKTFINYFIVYLPYQCRYCTALYMLGAHNLLLLLSSLVKTFVSPSICSLYVSVNLLQYSTFLFNIHTIIIVGNFRCWKRRVYFIIVRTVTSVFLATESRKRLKRLVEPG